MTSAFAVTTDVQLSDASQLAQTAAEYIHGTVTQVSVSNYLDVDNSVIAYAVKFSQTSTQQSVTVIASATHLQAPVQMVYKGVPFEQDAARTSAAAAMVKSKNGVVVSVPEKVYWAGPYAFYFSYQNGNILCQPTTGEVTSLAALKVALEGGGTGAVAGTVASATLAPKFSSQDKQVYISTQWNAAAAHLQTKSTGSSQSVGSTQYGYTRYIPNVPYLNQGQTPDCGVVSMMDILLYWQGKGFSSLINPSTLSSDRITLQQDFGWTYANGTYPDEVASGVNNFIKLHYSGCQVEWFSREAYSNTHYALYSTDMSFSQFTSEIDAGRPAQLSVFGYTQSNPTDHSYGNHAVAGVGYLNGAIYGGGNITQWAIIHDNWEGDPNFVNAYVSETEPYMDWSEVDEMIKVVMKTPVVTPQMQSPASGSTLTSSSATFTWSAGSNVSAYWMYVGTTLGGTDVFNSGTLASSVLSRTVTNIPTNGQTLHARLWWYASGAWNYTDYTYTEYRLVYAAATLVSPTPGSTFSSTTESFAWTAGTNATAYWLYVGTTAAGYDLYNSNQLSNSVLSRTASNLPTNGKTVYVRLWTALDGSWQYKDYTYKAELMSRAQMTSPAPNSKLTSITETFSWSAGSGATSYWLYVGSTLGAADVYNSNQLASNVFSRTVSKLPATGKPIYVRLWTLVGGTWQYLDYTYTTL